MTFIYMMSVAILGLLCAMAGWLILRFWAGAWAAMLGFMLLLYFTAYCVVTIAQGPI